MVIKIIGFLITMQKEGSFNTGSMLNKFSFFMLLLELLSIILLSAFLRHLDHAMSKIQS